MNTNPHTVLITCESVANPVQGEAEPVLLTLASAYDSNGTPLKIIMGCPTPCRPTGSSACQQQADNLISQLKQQFASSLL